MWREALLAQAALRGSTRGYKNHPQLTRFRALEDPVAGIAAYRRGFHDEASLRGYSFDAARIVAAPPQRRRIAETRGQLLYEWTHLAAKLRRRSPAWYAAHHRGLTPSPHPLVRIVPGRVRPGERLPSPSPPGRGSG